MASNPDQPIPSQPEEGRDVTSQRPAGQGGNGPGDVAPEQAVEESLESVQRAADEIRHETEGATDDGAAVELPDFDAESAGSDGEPATLSMLNDIDLHVKVELGRTRMYIEDVLKLNANSIVELDKAAGDPVDIYVNDRHVARGEVLVLSDNFCVRISEIIKQSTEEEEGA